MSEVADKVKKIIAEHLGIEDMGKITEEAKFIDDLGADSLDTVELQKGILSVLCIHNTYCIKSRAGDESRERGKHRRQARTQASDENLRDREKG